MMMKIDFKGPSKGDLTKLINAAAERQISEKARQAAAHFGGVEVKFKHKSDGSLDSVVFEGAEQAVRAAQNAVGS